MTWRQASKIELQEEKIDNIFTVQKVNNWQYTLTVQIWRRLIIKINLGTWDL